MHTRTLGKTGYQVSEIGLGCWQLGGDFGPVEDDTANAILHTALSSGINFWDTADVYGGGASERRIRAFLQASGDGAPAPIIATKVGRGDGLYPDEYSYAGVRASLESSADRLGVETIDLAQLHCVPPQVLQQGDIFTWMEDLRRAGLIRHWGASVETIAEAFTCLEQPGIASLQIIFNLFRQDAAEALLDTAHEREVGIIVRLPLASGLLTGKLTKETTFAPSDHRNYNRDGAAFSVGETFSGIPFEPGLALVRELSRYLPQTTDMATQALRWILDHEAVSTVIAGASRPQQVLANAHASSCPPLTESTHEQLAEFYRRQVRPDIRGNI
ncbi:aldo/keto reductase [Microbulbifer bruguierae]|uniref:Aldo/keto reductase n=1 Tax=Microbulbifer bruguierae TaxID=3029061 RepID=A0ABY8NIU8_9GAMM|nr:aldo/keto reductase [Microbulbifer bruguierae]WGL18364.1 aldo/keto reductase [Microbulbifer bruguierae]